MSQAKMEFAGEQVTFRELLRKHPRIEVPLIQRDYVQGRASAAEVRREFLRALERPLVREAAEPVAPLDLDFVYGNTTSAGAEAFLPLDGQQRLTTLFLLHWYAAWRDGETEDFASWMAVNGHSRFRYAVRPSTTDFFDALVNHFPDGPAAAPKLSAWIADQPWFFLSWRLDPTIDSVLTMLDEIDDLLRERRGLYRRLVQPPARITFQLLHLRNLELTDDLYIKMNARGKALTPFETFKARLEPLLVKLFPGKPQVIDGRAVSVQEYFSRRIDTTWADLLWNYRDERQLFDDGFMRLLRTLVLVTRDPDAPGTSALIDQLRDQQTTFTFFRYHEEGCLDETMLETLIAVLDRWGQGEKHIHRYLDPAIGLEEEALFRSVVEEGRGLSYERLVQFHAYTAYLVKHAGVIDSAAFGEWMRVVINLSVIRGTARRRSSGDVSARSTICCRMPIGSWSASRT
jgi:hypothetical protein